MRKSVLLFQFRAVNEQNFWRADRMTLISVESKEIFRQSAWGFSGLCLIIYAKVSFRFRAIIKCVAKERKETKGEMRSCCIFVTGSMGFRCVEREMDGKSTGFLPLSVENLPLSALFLRMWNFTAKKANLWRATVSGMRKKINFIFRCLYTCRDTNAYQL